MEKSWIEYKDRLLKAYFGPGRIESPNSAFYKDFSTFLGRYQQRVQRTKTEDTSILPTTFKCNEIGIPKGSFNRCYTSRVEISSALVDQFQIREVPEEAVKQFEFIVQLFLSFLNRQKFKKLKDLRKSQQALPIFVSRGEILASLKESQVVIIAGDTGCGKSTQLPQYLLNDGYKKVACTQPRRIATMALCRRVAFEILNEFGSEIAYQTRFEKTKTSKTRMLFLTDGLLLRQMAAENSLSQYDVIILDEIHERHISGDLLVALLRDLIQRRSDLKLILMSATINLDLFTGYFENAPVIQVPGRLYPIELEYMAVKEWDVDSSKKSVKIDTEPYLKILQIIDKNYPDTERGDVLVFLNGISEITMVAEAMKEYAEFSKRWIILILHSTLSVEEQNKVFDIAPPGIRKCILSTNIAETSVTIDEVRFVIDSGKVNLVRYDPVSRMHRLAPCWISKASADQRKGRAGRTGPGVCYRLYSQEQFNKMEPFTPSEIKRVSLESLVLQVLSMNLQINIRDFPFVEMPDRHSLEEAVDSLKKQGVINSHDEKSLTPLGVILADLPVDVLVGKMLVYACVLDQVDVTLTMAAGLSVQSPFTNRSFRDYECIQKRQHLVSDIGDPFTLVKTYREWIKLRSSGEDTRKWARKCGIEESRLFEIMKLRRQFLQILEQSDLIPKKEVKDAGSSRERRIKAGEKRKLRQLKKMAGFEEKKRKILKSGQHFDTIMNVVEEGEQATTAQDDINSLEFALMKNMIEIHQELTSHKINETTAILLKMIIAMGIYPQLAVEDPHNNHRVGTDQFCHTSNKPFVVLHPNSSLGQMPEALDIHVDDQGQSPFHQLVYFGLLLETTKPFLCNSARIPALFLLVAARNVTCKDSRTLSCDGFLDFQFSRNEYCQDVLERVCEIRRQFLHCLERKLKGEDYRSRELERTIVKFAKLEMPFGVKRSVNPPKYMDAGIFTETGEEYMEATFYEAKDFFNMDQPIDEEEEIVDQELDSKKVDEKKIGKKYFCEHCNIDLYFPSNVEILKHKKTHL